jgi:HPt (histidine-containing phosphotransfer) domain-containing protein
MGNSKKIDNVAVSTFADHKVIVPPNKLKKAVVKQKRVTGDEVDPVARAEQALADLSSEFTQWMDMECSRLDAARNQARNAGLTSKSCEDLFRAAHDIKGQAATLGFPLIAPVAESLCRLIEHTPEPARIPLSLIDQHVDGIRAIAHKNTEGNAERTAVKLADRLRQVTDEFLLHENRHRREYMEDLLGSPLAERGS